METHFIQYEGIEFEVVGEYSESDETTGYFGGWSTFLIKVNGTDVSWLLKDWVVEKISELVNEIR